MIIGKNYFAILAAGGALQAFTVCSTAHAEPFQIAEQPAATGIPEFARQAGLQIMASSEVVANKKTNAVEGDMDARQALNLLIRDTNLKVQADDGRTIILAQNNTPAQTSSSTQSSAVSQSRSFRAEQPPTATASATAQLEEVVVTAEKRSENIQDVPIAITAFSAQSLQDKSVGDLQALGNFVPNVNLDAGSPFSSSTSVLSASIRGIGQDDFAMNLDPGVGVYVDGVFFARTVGANQNLLDVERVEVLKGPQGTLFGRNTIGGAISVVTRTPRDEFAFQGQVTGGSYKRQDIAATVDVPFSDSLLSTITVTSQQRDGYQKRIPYPGGVGVTVPDENFNKSGYAINGSTLGGMNQHVIRAKFLWKAMDALKATLTADWTHEDQSATPTTVLKTYENSPFALAGIYNGCVTGGIPAGAPICGPVGPVTAPAPGGFVTAGPALSSLNTPYSLAIANTGDIDTSYGTSASFSTLDSQGVGLTLDWALTDDLTLKSITAYRELNWKAAQDGDGSPLHIFEPTFKEGQHQFSQELQLIGNAFDTRLNYVGGLYYFKEGGFINDYVIMPVIQVFGHNNLDTTAYAAFAHVNYKVTDKLGVTLGARYSIEDKKYEGANTDLNAFFYKMSGLYPVSATNAALLGFPDPSQPLRMFPPGVNKQDFSVFTPTVGSEYHFTDDLMSYVSWSKGFKSGGWTTRVTNPIPDAHLAEFGPEKAQTFEIGIKSIWLNNRLRMNLAGFYTKYEGIQLNFQQGTSPTIKNAGDAKIRGVELEANARIGVGLTLNGSIGYMDAYYTSLNAVAGPSDPVGTPSLLTLDAKLPKTPKLKVNVSPQYDIGLANAATLRFLVDWTHTSAMYNDSQNTVLLRRPTIDMLNASIQYLSPGDKYAFIVGGNNLSDKRYIVTGLDHSAGSGLIQASYNAPRTWYATLRTKFQ